MFRRFLLCSGTAALVNLAAGFLFYGVFGLDGPVTYPLSVAMAFAAGMVVSFVLNRRYTYEASGRSIWVELRDFFGVSIGGLVITTALATLINRSLTELGAEFVPLGTESFAHICAVGLTAIYSFIAHKRISFRKAESHPPSATPARPEPLVSAD
ncbi:GtrA family protein [Litorisediminicola beolgyonensis]|uniref:GtrA family protein n=1 Tax=Litorisediminicola beolgyonensis TaxID=1173614 RepID=A0ABW3ZJ57_9RHOB